MPITSPNIPSTAGTDTPILSPQEIRPSIDPFGLSSRRLARGVVLCSLFAAAATVPFAIAWVGPDWYRIPNLLLAVISLLVLAGATFAAAFARDELPDVGGAMVDADEPLTNLPRPGVVAHAT